MNVNRWMVMAILVAAGVILVATMQVTAEQPWAVAGESKVIQLREAASVIERQTKGPAACKLTLCVFDGAKFVLRVVSQQSRTEGKRVGELGEAMKAVAGCNGGYFDPRTMQPTNLEIAGGVRTGNFGSSGPSGGVLSVLAGRLQLLNEKAFHDDPAITELVQCGPMLIENAVIGVKEDKGPAVARTFVMTDGADRWAIGVCDKATLSQLAAMLASAEVVREFKVTTAMALDGGPSTGMWWSSEKGESGAVREKWPVRNVLMLVQR